MKKTARNDVTGDWLQSKPNNEMFEKNFDLIFRKAFDYFLRHKKYFVYEQNYTHQFDIEMGGD